MAFNGTGTFNRIYSWVTDAANSIFVSSSRMDTDTNDIAAGLSNCICKDGQTTITADIPMSGFKLTGLGAGSAANDSASMANLVILTTTGPLGICEFRLTLTTGVPVTTADVTAATTIYASPYKGNKIALYDGANWNIRTSAEFSLAVGTLTSGLPYDVFCYDNATVPTLEFLAWTNGTTRATALVLQNGVLVKSGATTRRYLGTFYTTATTTTEDSVANRYLWNYYNRTRRLMRAMEATASWNYTTATIRQANGATTNQLNFVRGVNEDVVTAEARVMVSNTSANVNVYVGIGETATTGTSGSSPQRWNVQVTLVASLAQLSTATYNEYPVAGRLYLSWNEFSAATGTTTWYSGGFSGIYGEIWG